MSIASICGNDPELYDKFVDGNKHLAEMSRLIITFVTDQVGKNLNKQIVEIGAGTGLLALPLAKQVSPTSVVALEPIREFCEALAEKAEKIDNLRVICHEKVTEYEPDTKFDAVTLQLTYHHIPDEEKMPTLEFIKSILQPGGHLVIGEEIIAPYQTEATRKQNDASYHDYRIEVAKMAGDPEEIDEQVRIKKMNECPYKVSLPVLREQLSQVGFSFVSSETVKTEENINHERLGYKVIIAKL